LSFWSSALQEVELPILYGERVERITPLGSEFEVMTAGGRVLRSATVLLALGRRGSPRKLGVPGEGQPKVHYRLVDPQQFRGRHVLVVGGGDSALEAALSLEKERGTTVTLSYRSGAFTRAKPKNRKRVEAAEAAGRIAVYLGSNVTQIGERDVDIECGGKPLHLANDAVIVCAGGVLPMGFLRDIGINVETKHGTA
jgi:thioredoxin reductase